MEWTTNHQILICRTCGKTALPSQHQMNFMAAKLAQNHNRPVIFDTLCVKVFPTNPLTYECWDCYVRYDDLEDLIIPY